MDAGRSKWGISNLLQNLTASLGPGGPQRPLTKAKNPRRGLDSANQAGLI